jgi:hypothetical protein
MVKITYSGNNKQQLQINCDNSILSRIRDNFSVANPAYRRNSRFAQTRLYAITPSGKFDFGMLDNILSFLLANQIEYKIDDEVSKNLNFNFVDKKIENFEPDYVYRDHQLKSIEKALKKGSGVILIPTAGGKTLIMAGLIKSIHANIQPNDGITLVLVPTIQLVEQTYNDFVTYGIENISKWSGKNKLDPNSKIIIAGTQILLSDNTDLSILNDVNILLIDECIRKNTLISTSKGNVKIQNIKIGDLVKSFNKKTNEIEYKPVLNTWKNLNKSNSYEEFLEIELENGNIVHLTPNHKVYTDNGYKRADELLENDNILFIDCSKWVTLRCKYLYAKTNTETLLLNMWKRIKIYFKTFEKFTLNSNIETILRQIFKKRIRRVL